MTRRIGHTPTPELAAEVGALIKDGRTRLGWTQDDMARRFGVTQGAVTQWERGVVLPSSALLVAMARLFGFDVADLKAVAAPVDTSVAS